jgi:preflagellin peptidase FlaK
MDQLQIIFLGKVIIVGLCLLVASIMDILTRRIDDRTWMIMLLACIPLLGWEMLLKGGDGSPISLLSLLLPIGGMLFIFFGYPEPKKAFKGSRMDIFFILVYLICIAGPVVAFMMGDRGVVGPILIAFFFMVLYFILYQVPIAGTRIIHGGADAKCLMALAALFPWYVMDFGFQVGPFYGLLEDFSQLGVVFNIHLSVLFNGAVLATLMLVLVLPVLNIIRGDFRFPRMFTAYRVSSDSIVGKHIWVILEHKKKKKVEPTEKVQNRLKEMGVEKVWVTPKIPFILFLFLGYAIQMIVGNLVAILFFMF